jgi:hypothetical protein
MNNLILFIKNIIKRSKNTYVRGISKDYPAVPGVKLGCLKGSSP